MSKDIATIKADRNEEYVTVAARRLHLLKELDQLNEFSSEEHYEASVLHLLKENNGPMPLARLELVHPNRVVLNKVRKKLKATSTIEDTKDGQTVMVGFPRKSETPKHEAIA